MKECEEEGSLPASLTRQIKAVGQVRLDSNPILYYRRKRDSSRSTIVTGNIFLMYTNMY